MFSHRATETQRFCVSVALWLNGGLLLAYGGVGNSQLLQIRLVPGRIVIVFPHLRAVALHDRLPPGDAEILLRSVPVQDVSGAAGNFLPHRTQGVARRLATEPRRHRISVSPWLCG